MGGQQPPVALRADGSRTFLCLSTAHEAGLRGLGSHTRACSVSASTMGRGKSVNHRTANAGKACITGAVNSRVTM
jgi:hypothetical protein